MAHLRRCSLDTMSEEGQWAQYCIQVSPTIHKPCWMLFTRHLSQAVQRTQTNRNRKYPTSRQEVLCVMNRLDACLQSAVDVLNLACISKGALFTLDSISWTASLGLWSLIHQQQQKRYMRQRMLCHVLLLSVGTILYQVVEMVKDRIGLRSDASGFSLFEVFGQLGKSREGFDSGVVLVTEAWCVICQSETCCHRRRLLMPYSNGKSMPRVPTLTRL